MKILLIQVIVTVFAAFIDLDTENITDVVYYSVANRSLVTPFVLRELFCKNPKTIISFNDTNSTIIPSNEILVTPIDELHKFRNFKFVEIFYTKKTLHNSLIPLSPCVSRYVGPENHDQNSLSTPVGVALTLRTAIYLRLSLGFGFSLGEAILIDTTTIGFTLGYKLTAKTTKQRMVDTTIGCYLDRTGLAARLFGYIPMLQVTPNVRKIIYDGRKVVVDHAWEKLNSRRIMLNSPIRTLCDIGTRNDLDCDANNGEVIDRYGNQMSWSIL